MQPLAIDTLEMHIEVTVGEDGFVIQSMEDGFDALPDGRKHSFGTLSSTRTVFEAMDTATKRGLSARAGDLLAHYGILSAAGLQYGPGFRRLEQGWFNSSASALAHLRARVARHDSVVDPADLDASLQLETLSATAGDGGTQLPFAVDVAQLQCGTRSLWTVSFAADL